MDGQFLFRKAAALSLATLALAWPGTAAISQDGEPREVSEPVVQDVPPSFADSFPLVPEPDIEPEAEPGAVDVTEIDPPIEEVPDDRAIAGGNASYYGRRFHGRPTANGERFNMNAMTAAHRTLPFGTRLRVTNPRNGRSVVVRVNDRGPFHGNRVIDVSRAAAQRLGLIQRGHGRVELAIID